MMNPFGGNPFGGPARNFDQSNVFGPSFNPYNWSRQDPMSLSFMTNGVGDVSPPIPINSILPIMPLPFQNDISNADADDDMMDLVVGDSDNDDDGDDDDGDDGDDGNGGGRVGNGPHANDDEEDDIMDSHALQAIIAATRGAARAEETIGIVAAIRAQNRAAMVSRAKPPHALLLYETEGRGRNSTSHNQATVPAATTRYLPLIRTPYRDDNEAYYRLQSTHQQRIDHSYHQTPCYPQWIAEALPVELFENITQHLSRDDIKSMRLVNKEFEHGVSGALFRNVVVPFNTELYDMIEQDKSVKRDIKGKRRADDPHNTFVDLEPGSLQWKNAMEDKENKVYRGHGLRVFQGFGAHIRKFGMSFEIREDALHDPPLKKVLDSLQSYFGPYEWPSQEYTRFDKLAGLEEIADQTSLMKLAFSHLQKVTQLALSIDSGLGWMAGPDKSMRSQILQRAPRIFGCSHAAIDVKQRERARFWESLEVAYRNANALNELKEGCLKRVPMQGALPELQGLAKTPYCDPSLWAGVDSDVVSEIAQPGYLEGQEVDVMPSGVLYVQPQQPDVFPEIWSTSTATETGDSKRHKRPKPSLIPSTLEKDQKEWLLEAKWAQKAFLMSYMLAVIDNSSTFSHVTVFNLARISSRLIPLFQRDDFWGALPNLDDVVLGVIPDWRTVQRDDAGCVETIDIQPSKAYDITYALLQDQIGSRSSIKKLKFGWAAGGEHAEGIYARNHHILPAPINSLFQSVQSLEQDETLISLPHVEHLTLSNCWITPTSLTNLVNSLENCSLQTITFDSVSLTAHPASTTANMNANAYTNAVAVAHQPTFTSANRNVAPVGTAATIADATAIGMAPTTYYPLVLAHQPPYPPIGTQTLGAQIWQGTPAGGQFGPWANTMLQQMHYLLQQNGINDDANVTLGQMMQTLDNYANGGLAGGVPLDPNAGTLGGPVMPNTYTHMPGSNQDFGHMPGGNQGFGQVPGGYYGPLRAPGNPGYGQPQGGHHGPGHTASTTGNGVSANNPGFGHMQRGHYGSGYTAGTAGGVPGDLSFGRTREGHYSSGRTTGTAGGGVSANNQGFGHTSGGHYATGNAPGTGSQQWYEGHRSGSWVDVLDALSPGKTLALFQPRDQMEPPLEPRDTRLLKMEFVSCGYAQLHSARFDQSVLEPPTARYFPRAYFVRRHTGLGPSMLKTNDKYLGRIVQYMSEREQDALRFAWDMTMGWQDEKLAEEPEYDGYLKGGTGRFSGVVTKSMAVGLAGRSG
ncbi:hypothetical protein MBLNU459_g7520t1 [Dothideomycetes sp. NU459]